MNFRDRELNPDTVRHQVLANFVDVTNTVTNLPSSRTATIFEGRCKLRAGGRTPEQRATGTSRPVDDPTR